MSRRRYRVQRNSQSCPVLLGKRLLAALGPEKRRSESSRVLSVVAEVLREVFSKFSILYRNTWEELPLLTVSLLTDAEFAGGTWTISVESLQHRRVASDI